MCLLRGCVRVAGHRVTFYVVHLPEIISRYSAMHYGRNTTICWGGMSGEQERLLKNAGRCWRHWHNAVCGLASTMDGAPIFPMKRIITWWSWRWLAGLQGS